MANNSLINPIKIITKYYKKNTKVYKLLINHSKLVTKKAIEIAQNVPELKPNIKFIKEAAMLHDIGIFLVNYPRFYCFGKSHYVCHGMLGRKLLEKEGLNKHALVCERHIGVGLTKDEIINRNLPLPKRDMVPLSIEEIIISFSDLFFSKDNANEKDILLIRKRLSKHGINKLVIFDEWCKLLKIK